ncbi:MAG: TIGR00366 family protein [Myxococcota bacterium]
MSLSLDRLARPFVTFSERYYPDPFVFAIGLTALTFGLAVTATPTTAQEALEIWGGGLTNFLGFAMQICIVLATAHALAHTDAVRRGIDRVARWPRSPGQAYAWIALLSGMASMVAGALGLVVGALGSRAIAREGRARGLRLHFPLLVASAYGGFLIWHMGYSGTAPLAVATPGHTLEGVMGILPITETTFGAWNLGIAAVTLVAVAAACSLLAPPEAEVLELEAPPDAEAEPVVVPDTPAARLDGARWLSVLLGLLFLAFVVSWFRSRGFQLTLDLVNWTFLAAGLLLARSPRHYLALIADACRTLGPVILQYPLYAAIVALITQTELVGLFSDGFVAVATPRTLGFWAFVSGGVLNVFVPSGGGQWAVQGPIFLQAARELGVQDTVIVMGVAYGDQWTNMIQPFWALPLLAIAGVNARAIMGYCFVIFLVGFVCLGGGLLVWGAG